VAAKHAVLSACEVTELDNTREMYFQRTLAAATQEEKADIAAEGTAALEAIEKRYLENRLAQRRVGRTLSCGAVETFATRLSRTVGEIGFARAV
jgi:hypothetical protein